jgi:hypothetical protein
LRRHGAAPRLPFGAGSAGGGVSEGGNFTPNLRQGHKRAKDGFKKTNKQRRVTIYNRLFVPFSRSAHFDLEGGGVSGVGAARFLVARFGCFERDPRRFRLVAKRGHLCRPHVQGGFTQKREAER